ncbi:hypothetical protein [Streptomyces sp. JNUCC 63]
MANRPCDGSVRGLKGQTICFTGRVLVDGHWTVRKRCAERAEQRGATYKAEFSNLVTLVVYGDLASKVVTDARRDYSHTLVQAEHRRRQERHVCVVDADGFSKLLRGHPAPCLALRRAGAGGVRPVASSDVGAAILGGLLRPQRVGRRTSEALAVDLSLLDKSTAAHELTVGMLIAHLGDQGVEVRAHARNAPRFDAGWSRGTDLFVAEVKSLTGASEDQQIRLGMGQVLDYTHQLRTAHPSRRIHPVLVLEKPPSDARWTSLARSVGVRLTWGPGFAGL